MEGILSHPDLNPKPQTLPQVKRRHAAWKEFVDANEISPVVKAYARLRRLYKIPKDLCTLPPTSGLAVGLGVVGLGLGLR